MHEEIGILTRVWRSSRKLTTRGQRAGVALAVAFPALLRLLVLGLPLLVGEMAELAVLPIVATALGEEAATLALAQAMGCGPHGRQLGIGGVCWTEALVLVVRVGVISCGAAAASPSLSHSLHLCFSLLLLLGCSLRAGERCQRVARPPLKDNANVVGHLGQVRMRMNRSRRMSRTAPARCVPPPIARSLRRRRRQAVADSRERIVHRDGGSVHLPVRVFKAPAGTGGRQHGSVGVVLLSAGVEQCAAGRRAHA
mmetsp:Transcript_137631/g.383883  ORF Transcript_137631/g.383883 Transcript_137631/m.383883 type:complete len:254 (+) Transcript_137631:306-1067(+)